MLLHTLLVSVTHPGPPLDEELTSSEPNLILPSASVRVSFSPWQTNLEEAGTLLSFSNCYKNIFRVAVKKIQHITILSYENLIPEVQLRLLIFTFRLYEIHSVPNKFHGCVARC